MYLETNGVFKNIHLDMRILIILLMRI